MASSTLYPPILEPILPTFIVSPKEENDTQCIVPFVLSSFYNGDFSVENTTAHVQITKQNTGQSCINNKNSGVMYYSNKEARFCVDKIIINVTIHQDINKGYYYIVLTDTDILNGWTPGWIYKIQIRLCNADKYTKESGILISTWLSTNSYTFSEWSRIGVIKATGMPKIKVPNIDLFYPESIDQNAEVTSFQGTQNFQLNGYYGNGDHTERLKSYRIRIYEVEYIPVNEDTQEREYPFEFLVEDSKDKYDSAPISNSEYLNNWNYITQYEPKNGYYYCIRFNFKTATGLEFELLKEHIQIIEELNDDILRLYLRQPSEEEQALDNEEGRISLKLYQVVETPYTGNILVRRAGEDSNFLLWEDIEMISGTYMDINKMDPIHDYTAESGKFYVYSLVNVDTSGNRGVAQKMDTPFIRNYEYSYLYGGDGRQLKLMFNSTMDNFKINQYELKTETIGSKYPVITRNSKISYKSFPVTGLISFHMDENKLFFSREEGFDKKYQNDYAKIKISNLYENYMYSQKVDNNRANIEDYDYLWEKRFRDKVMSWLHDGTPKLFKSPTEGNIIVRLMDITFMPNTTLGRMIYSFSATAYEIGEYNYENLVKYNFIHVAKHRSDFAIYETRIGQLYEDFITDRWVPKINIDIEDLSDKDNFIERKEGTNDYALQHITPDNIFAMIYDKYDSRAHRMGDYNININKVYGLKICFNDPPVRIKRIGTNQDAKIDSVLGYRFALNHGDIQTKELLLYDPYFEYEFDDKMIFGVVGNNKDIIDSLTFYPEEPYYKEAQEDAQKQINTLLEKLLELRKDKDGFYELLFDRSEDSFYVLTRRKRRTIPYALWLKWKADKALYDYYISKYSSYYGLELQIQDNIKQIQKIYGGLTETLNANVDFLYQVRIEPYLDPKMKNITYRYELGQFYQRMQVKMLNSSIQYFQDGNLISGIRGEVEAKYYLYLDLENLAEGQNMHFSMLSNIKHIEIEANPGAVFGITDMMDAMYEIHDMNETGTLTLYNLQDFYNIVFLGYRMPDGSLKTMDYFTIDGVEYPKPVWCDVMINYIVTVKEGEYEPN